MKTSGPQHILHPSVHSCLLASQGFPRAPQSSEQLAETDLLIMPTDKKTHGCHKMHLKKPLEQLRQISFNKAN